MIQFIRWFVAWVCRLSLILHTAFISCSTITPLHPLTKPHVEQTARAATLAVPPPREARWGSRRSGRHREEAPWHARLLCRCRTGLSRTLSWSGFPACCTLGEAEPELLCQPGFLSISTPTSAALDTGWPCCCEHVWLCRGTWKPECTRHRCLPLSDTYRSGEWSQLAVPSLQISSLWPFLCRWAGTSLYMLMCPFIFRGSPSSSVTVWWGFVRDSNRGVGGVSAIHMKTTWSLPAHGTDFF